MTEEDIPLLLSVGKEHLYVWENDESMMHENDAALWFYYDMCKNETHVVLVRSKKEKSIKNVRFTGC